MHEKAERPHAVVDAHDHDAAFGQLRAVVHRLAARAAAQRAAMDPQEYRRVAGVGGLPDVEEQAVLAALRQAPEIEAVGLAARLDAGGAELRGVTRALPLRQ